MKAQPQATLVAARILGPLFLITGIALIAQRQRVLGVLDAMLESDPLSFLAGLISSAVALVLLALHDYWGGFTQGLISVLGWIGLARGLTLIFAPQWANESSVFLIAHAQFLPILGCFGVFLGFWLIYAGFFGRPAEEDVFFQPR